MVLLKQKLWIDLKFNTKLLEPLIKNQGVISIISIFNKFFSDTNVTTSIFASIYLLKSTIEMSQQCEKFVPSYLKKHNRGNDAFLVASLYLTLNRFHTFLWRFYCWLWTSKSRLGLK